MRPAIMAVANRHIMRSGARLDNAFHQSGSQAAG